MAPVKRIVIAIPVVCAVTALHAGTIVPGSPIENDAMWIAEAAQRATLQQPPSSEEDILSRRAGVSAHGQDRPGPGSPKQLRNPMRVTEPPATQPELILSGSFDADACENAGVIQGEGTFQFDNSSATIDGPAHLACVSALQDNIDADVWACWTAPCTSTIFVKTCGLTSLDTKIAVYAECNCPVSDANLLSCNDDRCDLQSIVTFEAQAGRQYLIRVGVFPGASPGIGAIEITCGVDACGPDSGPCTVENGTPGCSDETCCETVCAIDSYCCDTEWDQVCADEAEGLCSGSFPACGVGAGTCESANGTPGCEDAECCNTVCTTDPFCCLSEWDDTCAGEAAQFCSLSCGPDAGDCFSPNGSPGCQHTICCDEVCGRDPYCCQFDWDEVCVELADAHCPCGTDSDCDDLNSCTNDLCDSTIGCVNDPIPDCVRVPTTSEWGLLIMALVGLVAGSIRFRLGFAV